MASTVKGEEGVAETRTTNEKVIDLLNQAQLASSESKLTFLTQVKELIINKEPTLLDNFLDEILMFQQDRLTDVRKFVVLFIEDACKKDPDLLTKTIGCLQYLLGDENVIIVKRVMLSVNSLYKIALQLVCKQRTIKEDIREMWESMIELKRKICGMIESDNDGVRTHAIKLMEMLILVHSVRGSDETSKKEGEVSLDIVPSNHPLVKYNELADEGMTTLEALLAMCASPNISSVNLMAVLSSLTSIGKARPTFLSTVIKAFESLHANLPPALSKSQVSSVRKNLKMQLFTLLKLPYAEKFLTQIGTLLTDLGATASEIQKSLPKVSKRPRVESDDMKSRDSTAVASKKIKSELKDAPTPAGQFSLSKAIELTTEDLVPTLVSETVTDLVLVSMLFLPRSMPPHFQETFTPIAAAGGQAQVQHLARLMATQMTNAGIGIGVEKAKEIAIQESRARQQAEERAKQQQLLQPKSIPVVGGGGPSDKPEEATALRDNRFKTMKIKQPRSVHELATELKTGAKEGRSRKIKPFRLQEAVQTMSPEERNRQILKAYKRILNADKKVAISGGSVERNKLLVGLAMQFHGELTQALIDFVMEDFRNRIDLGLLWLYQEYTREESRAAGSTYNKNSRYAACLRSLVDGIRANLEPNDKLFTRFILEAPRLSDGVRRIIKEYCMDSDRLMVGFATLRELIGKMPARCQEWLQLLLELTTAEQEQVRVQAIHSAKKLHSRPEFSEMIEDFAQHSLQQLLLERPPPRDITFSEKEAETPNVWNDDSTKAYLYLYLALLPINHALFLNLAEVYVEASSAIKRNILRHLEHPVRAIGMNSPDLLLLVENCPTGAETLVTRVLHIVTDKNPPTMELVSKVKELYHKRVSDVRFLIPVLNGLTKEEVIEVLPQLISQSQNVVKEVFNRLLGSFQVDAGNLVNPNLRPPLTPAELLVALHTIEAESDVKAIMKAINLCFVEKDIYTQEVLAVVVQHLMEITPLPTLFMRTVIQSLGMAPRLVGFVMNILSKLISKQVWKQPKVWQGFVKCVQMTKPNSFPVLLQLPPAQLDNILEMCPDVKTSFIQHIETLSPHQRQNLPRAVLNLLSPETVPAQTEGQPQQEVPTVQTKKTSGKSEKKRRKFTDAPPEEVSAE